MLCEYKKYKYIAKRKMTKSIEMLKSIRVYFQCVGMCIQMHSESMQSYFEGRRVYFESIKANFKSIGLGTEIWNHTNKFGMFTSFAAYLRITVFPLISGPCAY